MGRVVQYKMLCKTNKFVELGKDPKPRKPTIPSEIREALKIKDLKLNSLRAALDDNSTLKAEKDFAAAEYKSAKSIHQNVVRKYNVNKEVKLDDELNEIITKQPHKIYKSIKQRKTSQSTKVKSLKVGEKTYNEDSVADGFFDSISQLKTFPEITATAFDRFAEDHRHIVEICKSAPKIPKLSLSKAESLLKKIRPSVSDFFSITAAHYLNGGSVTNCNF